MRLYRTGDLARYLPDGTIEFLGRTDHQVKIRGFRIELGEIESVLGQHPMVRETIVLARDDNAIVGQPGDKRLVAYYVPDHESPPSVADLRDFVRQKLPAYMVPSAFITLEALPLTPNGKVDRRALPTPDTGRPELASVFVAPRTSVEETTAETWAGLFGIKDIGIHDNFFDLGGHSLLATQLLSRLRETFQIELPLRYVFETPTVAGLSKSIETVRWAAQGRQNLSAVEENDRDEGEL